VRTTVSLDDELLARAKHEAEKAGITLSRYLEEALRLSLAAPPARASGPVELPVSEGGEPRPGVDLTSNASLFELIDEDDRTP
jgi:hypothetical protein